MGIYAGFDIGGTKCAVVTGIEKDGVLEILRREAFATPSDQREALDRLCALADRLREGQPLDGVGISCGGPMNAETGELCSPPNLPGWQGLSLTRLVRERLHAPAVLENDANACALAEWRWGAGKGSRVMLFLTFGTGLGAGIVVSGRVLRGANGNAGELGHWRLSESGPAGYGKVGAFEGFCSGGGLAQLGQSVGQAFAQRGQRPAWLCDALTARDLAEAAFSGDVAAREVFRISARMLGRGLALAVDLLNPDCVVIGSVYTRSEALFREEMWEVLRQEALPASLSVCRVVPSGLGDAIGDCAALSLAVQAAEEGRA